MYDCDMCSVHMHTLGECMSCAEGKRVHENATVLSWWVRCVNWYIYTRWCRGVLGECKCNSLIVVSAREGAHILVYALVYGCMGCMGLHANARLLPWCVRRQGTSAVRGKWNAPFTSKKLCMQTHKLMVLFAKQHKKMNINQNISFDISMISWHTNPPSAVRTRLRVPSESCSILWGSTWKSLTPCTHINTWQGTYRKRVN